jgi:aminoglycoside phosphotransferase (APT) family kinase protein
VKTHARVPEKTAGGLSPRRARALVHEIARQYFGEKPQRLVQRGGGITNLTFEFRAAGGDYIVRLHAQPGRINHFLKEQWAIEHARAQGVPTPEVLEVDIEAVELPFMVSRKIEGREALTHPERILILQELGRIAARLHRAPTQGFGKVFDWSNNRLSYCSTWGDYLDNGLQAEACIAALVKARMLTPEQREALEAQVDAMRRWRKPPVLNHGDLRLKNVMVAHDSPEVVAVIDWDESLSAPAPYWDLAVALHDLGIDEKEAFLEGYGLTPREYTKMLPYLRALNTLNYGAAVEQLVLQKDTKRLAWYRARLQGKLDVYLPGTP